MHKRDKHPMAYGSLEHRLSGVFGGYSQVSCIECVVLKAYYKDDEANVSKQHMEYDVLILNTKTKLTHLRQLNGMGGFNDGDNYVLRETTGLTDKDNDPTWSNAVTSSKKLNGDRVLVAFINGSQDNPVIMGVLPHPATSYGGTREQGRRRFAQHQGSSWVVDKDGNMEVDLKDDDKITVKSKNTTLTIDDKAKKTTIDIGGGAAQLVVDGDSKKITIKSQGQSVCELGDATDAMLLGTTYRNAEAQENNQLGTQLQTAGAQTTAAAAQLTAAAGPLAIPVVGGILAAPLITAAATLLNAAGAAQTAAAAAIKAFEATADTYLSKKNKLD